MSLKTVEGKLISYASSESKDKQTTYHKYKVLQTDGFNKDTGLYDRVALIEVMLKEQPLREIKTQEVICKGEDKTFGTKTYTEYYDIRTKEGVK